MLPMIALAGNIAYRVYELYLVRYSTEVFTSQELVIAFAPSMINLVLFFGLLSIQISQLREGERSAPEAMKLLEGPRHSGEQKPSVKPSREASPVLSSARQNQENAEPRERSPAGETHRGVSPQENPDLQPREGEIPERPVKQRESAASESGPVKKKPREPHDLNKRIARIRVSDDPVKREQMVRKIQSMKGSLQQVLELAQYNGQLKKPRKRKKPASKRTRKASA